MKRGQYFVLFLFWIGGLLSGAPTLHAARPLFIDDAEPVVPGLLELEAGFGHIADLGLAYYDAPLALTYGVVRRLEIGVGIPAILQEQDHEFSGDRTHSGFGDLSIGAKAKFLEAERWWADQSLVLAVNLPTGRYQEGLGSGGTDYSLTWIVSRKLTQVWHLHWNVGYTWVDDSKFRELTDILHYGFATDYHLTQRVQLVGEAYALTPITAESDTSLILNGGIRWQPFDRLLFDAAVGGVAYGPAEGVLFTVGLTWTFGRER